MAASKQEQVENNSDELSLKDLILKVKNGIRFLWSKKYVLIIAGLIGGGVGLVFSLISKPKYIAELTFVLEDNNSNPLGAYIGLANQFGIDLGGSSGVGVFSGDNVMQFLKSRLIVEKTLLSPIEIGGVKMSMVDRYIQFNNLKKDWKDNLKNLSYPLNRSRANFNLAQDSVLYEICKDIVKSSLKVEKSDPKLSFIAVTVKTDDEFFSKVFTETLVRNAINFYIDTKTGRTRESISRLQAQADSLENALNRKTFILATKQDLNQNPVKQIASVGTELAQRDKVILQTMYGEVMKNLEISKLTMTQETPIIQIIDTPILPLPKKLFGKIMGLVIGGFLGVFLACGLLVMTKVLRSIIQD